MLAVILKHHLIKKVSKKNTQKKMKMKRVLRKVIYIVSAESIWTNWKSTVTRKRWSWNIILKIKHCAREILGRFFFAGRNLAYWIYKNQQEREQKNEKKN